VLTVWGTRLLQSVIRPVQAVSEDIFIRTVRPRRIVNCLTAPPRNILTYLLTYYVSCMDQPWFLPSTELSSLIRVLWVHLWDYRYNLRLIVIVDLLAKSISVDLNCYESCEAKLCTVVRLKLFPVIFAARCYASAACAVMRCLSVCVSLTFVNSVKTNKYIFEIFSPSGSHAILVFPYQTSWRYSNGDSLMGRRM